MTQDKPDLGEQALSKVVELGITSQLDEVEEIDVDIRTDPAKLVQGKVDSVAIAGEGMVMKDDLRMESMHIQTGSVAVNPLGVAFGKVEFTQPTDAEAQVVLTEADLNRALSSEYIRNKMQNLDVEINGEPTKINIQQAQIYLPTENQMEIAADIKLVSTGETKHFSAIAKPEVKEQGQRIELDILSAEGEGLTVDFITPLFEKIVQLLDLRNFDIQGLTLRLQALKAQKGKLLLHAITRVEQFPSL